jgi:hypothetical protein
VEGFRTLKQVGPKTYQSATGHKFLDARYQPVWLSGILSEWSGVGRPCNTDQLQIWTDVVEARILDMIALGMNGAALAALGDMDGSFLGVVTGMAGGPLGERWEGVKLGESTFRVFFVTLLQNESD